MSMSWWWSIGAARKHEDDHGGTTTASKQSFQSVALVVGSTGIVGMSLVDILPRPDTPGGPWKVYALSRRPLPPWSQPTSAAVTQIQVDLTDFPAIAQALDQLKDITHVFYVAWSPHATEAQNREANSAMFRNIISAVVTNCSNLFHISLQTGTKHYIGPFELIGKIWQPEPPYTEDMPRLDCPNFYYDQEDILFDEVARRGGTVTWSVHGPSVIYGFSPRSVFNTVCSLCVYATVAGVP
ncbi:hypothetical protein PR202_ga31036 [Eleusine coracana subsp. coracana]|uniref:PRISE-like Rossmann-fold domain-containing protein n=1 Tax=Eleusine coracana subsp. coracana TaxID=191504 RepID=A0AAV5DS34_ELECO|nr:hypothetical protein PR202_ga31036 [Eleusine coracana subsp. coracana]